MPIGYISYINHIKHYGFIDSPDLKIDLIFFRTTNCQKSYINIHKGDKVSFEYDPIDDPKSGVKEIAFLKNASLECLKNDFLNGKILNGFLKKIDNNYYVKDSNTYIFIQLVISSYEINLQEVYEEKLNTKIDYKITLFTAKNKIRAININRQLLPECRLLVVGNKTKGQVVSIVKGGYQIKVYERFLGFLPKSLAESNPFAIEEGVYVDVVCIIVGENFDNSVFDLTENFETENRIKIEREKFIGSLKTGDKFLGKIKNVEGFGVFVSFGLSVGLLHVNNIIGDPIELPMIPRKEFSRKLEQVFKKGEEIEIIIYNKEEDRISLTWDKHMELNRNLFNVIYKEYKTLQKKENEEKTT